MNFDLKLARIRSQDVPLIPMKELCDANQDQFRTQKFPNLDYVGLYNVLVQLLEILPQVQVDNPFCTIRVSSFFRTFSLEYKRWAKHCFTRFAA